MPVYATEDANGRHRMLKYTPEHMHCLATIYGAMAPPNTGVLAIQTSTTNQQVRQTLLCKAVGGAAGSVSVCDGIHPVVTVLQCNQGLICNGVASLKP